VNTKTDLIRLYIVTLKIMVEQTSLMTSVSVSRRHYFTTQS